MIESGLSHLLSGTTSVTNIVSDQIHLGMLPKGYSLPAVVISSISATEVIGNDGTADLRAKRFQFDCLAPLPGGYPVAHHLALAIKALLQDYRGSLNDGSQITGSQVINELDNPFEEAKGGFAYRTLIDIRLWFKEANS
jgi:hypothetical protein